MSILAPFSEVKNTKNRKKTVLKNIVFFTSNFKRFFADFFDFGSILGGPGPSKKLLKIEKIANKIDFRAHLECIGCSMVT